MSLGVYVHAIEIAYLNCGRARSPLYGVKELMVGEPEIILRWYGSEDLPIPWSSTGS